MPTDHAHLRHYGQWLQLGLRPACLLLLLLLLLLLGLLLCCWHRHVQAEQAQLLRT